MTQNNKNELSTKEDMTFLTIRISKTKLARIDKDAKEGKFPDRSTWVHRAIDHFLGDI